MEDRTKNDNIWDCGAFVSAASPQSTERGNGLRSGTKRAENCMCWSTPIILDGGKPPKPTQEMRQKTKLDGRRCTSTV